MSVSYFPTRLYVFPAVFMTVLFLAGGSFALLSQEGRGQELKKQGIEQYLAGDYVKAIETFKQMEGVNPGKTLLSQAYLYISMSHYCLEEYEQAKEWLNRSLETAPEIESTGLIFPPGYDSFFKETKDAKAAAPEATPEASPAVSDASRISLRIHGGWSYLQAKDVNTGAGGFFDFFTLLGESAGYDIDGGHSPVHGGFDFGADLVIQVSPTIGIGIGAGYLQSSKGSEMTLTYLEDTVPILGKTKLSAIPIRLGLFLTLPVSDKLNFTANAGAAVYTSLKYRVDLWVEVEEEEDDLAEISASRTSFGDIGFQGGLGFEYLFTPKAAFFVEALGRYARFKNYASVNGVNLFSDTNIDGTLYLGTYTDPDMTLTLFTIEETPPTPDEYTTYREPKFDFSGFCLQAGIRIRF